MIFELDKDIIGFPDPRLGDIDGAFAIGGDISPQRMRLAYDYGILPWCAFRRKQPVWFCPMQRFVIPPDEIHVSKSMRNILNRGIYHVTFNRDFEGVIRGCSEGDGVRERRDLELCAWLGEEMIQTMLAMHATGDAMSVEVWDSEGRLAGGLYGILSGHIFCGESMFSRAPSASKVALISLARLFAGDRWTGPKITLIDCQFETPHLKSMGGRYISYEDYLAHNDIVLPPLDETDYMDYAGDADDSTDTDDSI